MKEYEEQITPFGSFKSVESFWGIYNHLVRADAIPAHAASTDVLVFKEGIKPMWEDPANTRGGQLVLRVPKQFTARCWELLLMALVGEQFDTGHELCGVVLSVRYREDKIAVWNRNADNSDAKVKIEQTVRKVLSLPEQVTMEYKRHHTVNPGKGKREGGYAAGPGPRAEGGAAQGSRPYTRREGGGGDRDNRGERRSGPGGERGDRGGERTKPGDGGYTRREGGYRDSEKSGWGERPAREGTARYFRHDKEGEGGADGGHGRGGDRERERPAGPKTDAYAQNWRRAGSGGSDDMGGEPKAES